MAAGLNIEDCCRKEGRIAPGQPVTIERRPLSSTLRAKWELESCGDGCLDLRGGLRKMFEAAASLAAQEPGSALETARSCKLEQCIVGEDQTATIGCMIAADREDRYSGAKASGK